MLQYQLSFEASKAPCLRLVVAVPRWLYLSRRILHSPRVVTSSRWMPLMTFLYSTGCSGCAMYVRISFVSPWSCLLTCLRESSACTTFLCLWLICCQRVIWRPCCVFGFLDNSGRARRYGEPVSLESRSRPKIFRLLAVVNGVPSSGCLLLLDLPPSGSEKNWRSFYKREVKCSEEARKK